MMNAVYIGVILVFIFLTFKNQVMPYIRQKEKKKKLPDAVCVREVVYPRYKILSFDYDVYGRADTFSNGVEYDLNKICGNLVDRGFDLSGHIEVVSVRNVLLVFLRYPDKRVLYPLDTDVKDGGEKK